MHEEWTDRLSDYLDDELPADERAEVEAHLRTCAACSAVLNDVKRVVARAQATAGVSRPPLTDVWAGIAEHIDAASTPASASRRGQVAAFRRRASRRIALTLSQLAAAAVVVAAVSGGLAWEIAERKGKPEGARYDSSASVQPSAEPSRDVAQPFRAALPDGARIETIGLADAQYDAAVADLEKAVKTGRGRLDASTIAIVEHNLQIIDQAIHQAREALVADPANSYLSSHLVEARRRKLDLLRRAAALTTDMN
jgi:anti-sigma factor RsiW